MRGGILILLTLGDGWQHLDTSVVVALVGENDWIHGVEVGRWRNILQSPGHCWETLLVRVPHYLLGRQCGWRHGSDMNSGPLPARPSIWIPKTLSGNAAAGPGTSRRVDALHSLILPQCLHLSNQGQETQNLRQLLRKSGKCQWVAETWLLQLQTKRSLRLTCESYFFWEECFWALKINVQRCLTPN